VLFALAVLVALCAGPVLAKPGSPATSQAMVSVSKQAYLREGAGTRHAAQWLLDPGYPLQVIGRQGNWLQVRDFEDDSGWIYRPLTSAKRHHVVTSTTANIRRGPSTRTPVLGQAKYGEVLRTLERRERWVKVKQPSGATGWVARRLLWGW
jgi:SH3-like domain-containing protein